MATECTESATITDTFTVLSGAAAAEDNIYFSGELEEVAKNEPNSTFFLYDVNDGEVTFGKYDESVAWPAVSMVTHKPQGGERLVIAMGPHGTFWEVRANSGEEIVGALKEKVNVPRLAVIDGEFFACDMAGVVLQLVSTEKWNAVSADGATGFEALAGFSVDELYAAGWGVKSGGATARSGHASRAARLRCSPR